MKKTYSDGMTLERLDTGYWHARWNQNQWIQWPVGQLATAENGFGWINYEMISSANERANKLLAEDSAKSG